MGYRSHAVGLIRDRGRIYQLLCSHLIVYKAKLVHRLSEFVFIRHNKLFKIFIVNSFIQEASWTNQLSRDQQIFHVKDNIVNIFNFVGSIVCVTTIKSAIVSAKAAINIIKMNAHDCSNKTLFKKQAVEQIWPMGCSLPNPCSRHRLLISLFILAPFSYSSTLYS